MVFEKMFFGFGRKKNRKTQNFQNKNWFLFLLIQCPRGVKFSSPRAVSKPVCCLQQKKVLFPPKFPFWRGQLRDPLVQYSVQQCDFFNICILNFNIYLPDSRPGWKIQYIFWEYILHFEKNFVRKLRFRKGKINIWSTKPQNFRLRRLFDIIWSKRFIYCTGKNRREAAKMFWD